MARGKKKEELSLEEKLEQALVPVEEQPYDVPGNWCWIRLLDAFNNLTDSKKKLKTKEYLVEGEYPIIDQGKEFIGGYTDNESIVYEGELPIIIFGDHTRCIKYIDFSFAQGADGVKILRPKFFWNTKAFYYAFQSIEIPNMGYRRHYPLFKDFYIPVPPLGEQQRIVERIESLFAKLDEVKEKVSDVVQLSEIRQLALINHLFTGELVGIKDAYTIPLIDIVEEIKIGPFGSSLHQEDYIMGGTPVINPKHINKQRINPDKKVSITSEKARELSSYVLKENDIIMGRRGEMGRTAPVSQKEEGYICGTGSLIIRLKKEFRADLYSQILGSQSVINHLEQNCVGSTMKNLNEKIVNRIPIPYFTKEQQDKLMFRFKTMLAEENQILDKLGGIVDAIRLIKKSILAKAFRGELGTNNPEEQSAVEALKTIFIEL